VADAENEEAANSIDETAFSSFDTAQVDRAYSAAGGSAAASCCEDVDYVNLGSSISTSDAAAAGTCVYVCVCVCACVRESCLCTRLPTISERKVTMRKQINPKPQTPNPKL
jgi:hypothetical protein